MSVRICAVSVKTRAYLEHRGGTVRAESVGWLSDGVVEDLDELVVPVEAILPVALEAVDGPLLGPDGVELRLGLLGDGVELLGRDRVEVAVRAGKSIGLGNWVKF